jgi:hypothetical protein
MAFAVLSLAAAQARAATEEAAVTAARLHALKRLQQEILMSEGSEAWRATARGRRGSRRNAALTRSERPREWNEVGFSRRRGGPAAAGRTLADPTSRPGNVLVNPRTIGQFLSPTQSEVSVAAVGHRLVAAWNDGDLVDDLQAGIGFGYSLDGGRTWIDGGIAPRTGSVVVWTSDPVMVADEKTGFVYLAGMVITSQSRNGVAVVRGRFTGAQFQWDPVVVARSTRDTLPDKPWVAVDSLSGRLYLSYTTFFKLNGHNADEIELQVSSDGNQSWEPPVRLSSDEETGMVQGSRPAIGAAGETYVVWKTIDTTATAAGLDVIRMRTSRDGGVSFGAPVAVAHVFTNFCSGPPGFNRGFGLGFPAIAVDRGAGPRRGRIYVTWEEPLDFYDDPLGTGATVVEAEGAPDTRITAGDAVQGAIEPAGDLDWFRFSGQAGQTAVVYLDSMSRGLDLSLRLWCGDRQTALAYSAPLIVRPRVILYTLPESGDYLVSVASHNDTTGSYHLLTGLAARGAERGRDQRDVFVAASDDGETWSEPVRVNDDPPRYDAWLPEVAVAHDGSVFLVWYDWRDSDPALCGGASHVYLARSDDGGASWSSLGPVTRAPTDWSVVGSNLSPNMGDYLGLVEDGRAVYPFWADGAHGDPDVFMATWARTAFALQTRPLPTVFLPAGPRVQWQSPDSLPLAGTLMRRSAWSDWVPLRAVKSDAAGVVAATDATAEPGVRYHYQLRLTTSDGERATAEITVDVPDLRPATLAVERLLENPTRGSIRMWFRRPSDDPAAVELFDVGGRLRLTRTLGPEFGRRGLVEMDAEQALPPGLYLLRLIQNGRSAAARVVVLR